MLIAGRDVKEQFYGPPSTEATASIFPSLLRSPKATPRCTALEIRPGAGANVFEFSVPQVTEDCVWLFVAAAGD